MNPIDYLKKARKEGFAIAQFNACVLEEIKAAALAAQECKAPVIIGLSEGERGFMNPKVAVAATCAWAESAGIPMFVNADHTRSLELVDEALNSGFVMIHFDGPKFAYDENVKLTQKAVENSRRKNPDISIEGELGYLKGSSSLHGKVEISPEDLTKPEQALKFKNETNINALAVAVGNIHGLDVETGARDQLDINRIREISKITGLPLVLHGASDISNDQVEKAIATGICKININTALRISFINTIRSVVTKTNEITLYKVMEPVVQDLKKIMVEKIKLFGASNKI